MDKSNVTTVMRSENRCHEDAYRARWIDYLSNGLSVETLWAKEGRIYSRETILSRILPILTGHAVWLWEYAQPISPETLRAEHESIVRQVIDGILPPHVQLLNLRDAAAQAEKETS